MSKMNKKFRLIFQKLITALIIVALTNGSFANIYIPIPFFKKHDRSKFVKAKVFKTEDFDATTLQLLNEGFVPIQSKKFDGQDSAKGYEYIVSDMEKRADMLGASIVVFSDQPSENMYGYYTFLNPAPQNSQNQRSNDHFFGSNTSNGLTESVPVYNPQKKYKVSYFYKFDSITGIYPVDLSDTDQSKVGYTQGIKVKVIKNSSPAFNRLVENDIILKINDIEVRDVNHFVDISNYLKKGNIQLEILRKGEKIMKEIIIL